MFDPTKLGMTATPVAPVSSSTFDPTKLGMKQDPSISAIDKQLHPDTTTQHPLDTFLQNTKANFNTAVTNLKPSFTDPKSSLNAANPPKSIGEAANRAVAHNPLTDTLVQGTEFVGKTIFEGLNALTNGSLKGAIGEVGDLVANSKTGKAVSGIANSDAGKSVQASIGKWAQDHPDAVKGLHSILTLASVPATAEGISGAIEGAPAALKAANEGGAAFADVVGGGASKVKEAFKGVKGNATKAIMGPAKEEILATAEADVPKLKPADRATWFENQKAQAQAAHETNLADIHTKGEAMTSQIKSDLAAKSEVGLSKADALNKQAATVGRDKVIELRPKILKSMSEQSGHYRSLVDEAMAGKESILINKTELRSYVDKLYSDDPIRAANIKTKLGLGESIEAPPGGAPIVEGKSSNLSTTLGDVYGQMKDLKQTMGGSATKVFSASDNVTNDATHTLLSFLKENGVDLAEPNKFWAQYAPIRDQAVRTFQPFNQAGTNTAAGAKLLQKVASGADVNNENFVATLENLIGEPITGEVKASLGQISANEKQMIADEIAAEEARTTVKASTEEAKTTAKSARDKTLQGLSDSQFEIDRQAKLKNFAKNVLWKTLKGAVGLGATIDVLKHF